MAFFKSFQQTLPSVNISSILDSVTSRVDDLANAVSDVTYAVSDQLTEQVTTIINKVQEEEEGENNTSGQGSAQPAMAQEGKAANKSMWQMSRDSETGNTVSKNNQPSDSGEAEYTPSQLEWEWKDGCWRVKKTEAELAEEAKRKKEEKELQEKREQRRKERREKQLEKEAESQRKKEESLEEEREEEADEKTDDSSGQDREVSDSGVQSAAQQRSNDCDEAPHSPAPQTESRKKEEGEEEMKKSKEKEEEGEKEAKLSRKSSTGKKKKSDKRKGKGAKEDLKKSEKASDVAKKKEKGKKSKKKKKGNQEGVLSDSEEDRGPEAVAQQDTTSVWSSKHKEAAEQGGYSSEASSEQGGRSPFQKSL